MLFDISKYCYNSEEEEKNTASVTENVYRSNYLNLNSKGQFFSCCFLEDAYFCWLKNRIHMQQLKNKNPKIFWIEQIEIKHAYNSLETSMIETYLSKERKQFNIIDGLCKKYRYLNYAENDLLISYTVFCLGFISSEA